MNKNGFTLIEIIVTLILLSTITFIAGINITKKNESFDINSINKKILEAANIYVEIKRDINGNSYLKEIVSGAKGVKIPLKTLMQEGYIEEDIVKDLYNYKNELVFTDKNKDYYILFTDGGSLSGVDYCDSNEITSLLSWMDDGEPVYLCNDYSTGVPTGDSTLGNIEEINKSTKIKVDLDKTAVSEEFYNNASEEDKAKLTFNENGIYTLFDETTKKLYSYYRGAVNSNYLKLGKDKDNNDIYWRILWLSDDNKMKVVLDDNIPLTLTNSKGDVVTLSNTYKKMYNFSKSGKGNYSFMNASYSSERDDGKYYDVYYTYVVEENDIFPDFISLDTYTTYSSSNYYMKETVKWYESTNLNTFEYITKTNNFCYNKCYLEKWDGEREDYQPSETFECVGGRKDEAKDVCTIAKAGTYSSPVGFLTYGDAIRAGLSRSSTISGNLVNSGNFLFSSDTQVILSDPYRYEYYNGGKGAKYEEYKSYYINRSGLTNGLQYSWSRGGSDEDHWYYYTLKKTDGTILLNQISNNGKNGMYETYSVFLGYSLKPTMIIDMTSVGLGGGSGTKVDPFILE